MKRFCKRTFCLLLTLALFAGLLPALSLGASAAATEERQQALVAVAMAYYDKGHSMQYDGNDICAEIPRKAGGKTRSTNQEAPEYATPNETLFTVCSDFAHQVYWEAYRYQLGGSAGGCWTGGLAATKETDPQNVYKYTVESGKNASECITEMLKLAQPGDVVTTISKGGAGHTMVYVGDVLGNGKTYLAHSYGVGFSSSKRKDTREYGAGIEKDSRYGSKSYGDCKGGTIRLSEAEPFMQKTYGTQGSYKIINIIRPLNAMDEAKYPITPATKYRMAHPRLAIDRLIEGKSRFVSAVKGEKLTLSITLKNSSETAYTVPVTEKVPQGVTLKSASDGGAASGDTITWNVEVPAGGEKKLTAEYEVTASRGEKIVFTDGSVGDIPSNTIPITVAGTKLTAEEIAKLADVAAGKYDGVIGEVNAAKIGNVIWQKVLGLNVKFPDHKQILRNLMEEKVFSNSTRAYVLKESSAAEDQLAQSMMVPMLHLGKNLWNEWGHDQCADPKDMHLEPGDVIVRAKNVKAASLDSTLVYLGGGKYLMAGASAKKPTIVEEPEFVMSLTTAAFYALRPALAYDDIHTLPALPAEVDTFKFTDVKESDWFYEYVRDLVEDGTVNGMTETTFVPNGTLTYGQALKLIALAVGEKEPVKSGSHWASGYLTLAKEKKWLDGDVDLNGTITRLALCKIAAKAKNLTKQPEKNPFTDTSDTDVLALNKAGVINGMTETEFQPNGLLTRAQISKIIWTLRGV